jgi:hypothetical protein
MNSVSINFKFFIECDSSPFIVFDNSGKIIYLNNSSEILLGYVSRQELYDITLAYAPKDFGSKSTRVELQYDSFSFYAINVSYENEEKIALRLYHKPKLNSSRNMELDKLPMTDINVLLEANIALFKLKNSNNLKLLVDQDLPQCRIDQNEFSKLLRKVLNSFSSSDSIDISLKLLVGEYVIIQNCREHLVELYIKANSRSTDIDSEIKSISEKINISPNLTEYTVKLQIPFVQ